jgi:ABC-type multidrug transport system, ATPase component
MTGVVVARGLVKRFVTREGGLLWRGRKRVVEALRGVSFEARRGEIFGLLGPNGAGKTTTIKILSTLLLPDAGEAWVNGYDVVREPDKVRESIGVSLYSDRGFYWKLTGRENLMYFARLYHLDPAYARERIRYLPRAAGPRGGCRQALSRSTAQG